MKLYITLACEVSELPLNFLLNGLSYTKEQALKELKFQFKLNEDKNIYEEIGTGELFFILIKEINIKEDCIRLQKRKEFLYNELDKFPSYYKIIQEINQFSIENKKFNKTLKILKSHKEMNALFDYYDSDENFVRVFEDEYQKNGGVKFCRLIEEKESFVVCFQYLCN